jgi:6-phosphogluconolactonase (cycloisomerase 2 family)
MRSFRRFALPAGTLLAGCAVYALTASAASAASTTGTATPSTATAAAATSATTSPAWAGAGHAVFVQTDNTAGNQVEVYARAADGTLSLAHSYPTGGLGGALTGSVVDHLASQGSLTYDAAHGLLYAVNAGSNTVSVFAVDGTTLSLRQTVPSGGAFPVSVAVHGDVVYVLNAENGGSIQGFRVVGGRGLVAPQGWNRQLGLDADATPQFTHTPGQVGFTDDGRQLLVTTKAAGNDVYVYRLAADGAPSTAVTIDALPGTVPFAFVGTGTRQIALVEAGTNAVATFQVGSDGTLTQLATLATGQAATCWIAGSGDLLFASNAGSADETGLRLGGGGTALTGLGETATDAGTVDAAATPDGRYLYVQTGGAGIVDAYRIGGSTGTLTEVGSVSVAGATGGEGIAVD